jgi:Holliday junction resolvase
MKMTNIRLLLLKNNIKPENMRGAMVSKNRAKSIQRWRRRGFYSETALVKKLERFGYRAVRVPVSNPSRNPLPDIIARRDNHVYAFEVKGAGYYAYFPKRQIEKLFRFLDELIPLDRQFKHAVLAAHFGRQWIFREMNWKDWEGGKLAEQERILKRDKGNFDLKRGERK